MENIFQLQPNIFGTMNKSKSNLARLYEKKNKIKSVVKRMKVAQRAKLDGFLQDKLDRLM